MNFELPENLRRATDVDVPVLRTLVNSAYRELADRGLNFTGTYQDEAVTRERLQDSEGYMLYDEGRLVASILVSIKPVENTSDKCVYINQLAVEPALKRRGYGSRLLALAEARAKAAGIERMRLDTAAPAIHLIKLYKKHGYEIVKEVQWEGKTYRSYIMEKFLE